MGSRKHVSQTRRTWNLESHMLITTRFRNASSLTRSCYWRTNWQNTYKKSSLQLPQHIKETWNIHTFAQYTSTTSKFFSISIPISLEALQQHNPKSPNLTLQRKQKLQYIERGAHFPRREGAPLVEKWDDKCEKWGCHLSPNSHKSLHVKVWGMEGSPPLLSRCAPFLGLPASFLMRHISWRGAH